MNLKIFFCNGRLNNLLAEIRKFDIKLNSNDPSLIDDVGYKKFEYHFNPITTKEYCFMGAVAFFLVLASSMILVMPVSFLKADNISFPIVFSIFLLVLLLFSSIFLGFLFLGKGDRRGVYIHRSLYQIILFFGVVLLINCTSFFHLVYFSLIIFLAFLVKIMMGSSVYFNIIMKIKYFKITHELLSKDTKKY